MRRRVSTFGAVVGVDVMVEAADEASKKDPSRKGRRGRQNAKVKWKVRKVRLCSNSSGRSQVGRGGNCRPKGRKEQEQERKREWKPRGRYWRYSKRYLHAAPKANRGPGLARNHQRKHQHQAGLRGYGGVTPAADEPVASELLLC